VRRRAQNKSAMAIDIDVTRRRFTVDEYDRMVEVGILTKADRVELIHGEIVQMAPIGSRHTAAVAALHEIFVKRLDDRALVRSAGSIRLPPHSAPEPDVVVLRRRSDFYRDVLTEADHVFLLVEVAETPLRYDREVKVPLYAAAGIREVWIVDIEGECVEIYAAVALGRYRRTERITRGTSFSPEAVPDVSLTVADILG
jgi:Uma2 family endonuclease